MVDIGRVVEGGKEDAEDAHGGDGDAYRGDHPVDGRVAGKPKPENPNGHQGRLDTGEGQSTLGGPVDLDRVMFDGVVFLADGEERGEDGTDADGGEDGAGLFQRESVVDLVHQGDRAKLQIQNGPGKPNPQTKKEDHGFGEEHVDRSVQGHGDHAAYRGSFFVGLDFPPDAARFLCVFSLVAVKNLRFHTESAGLFQLFVPLVEDLGLAT